MTKFVSLIQRIIPMKGVGNTLVFSFLIVKLEKNKNGSKFTVLFWDSLSYREWEILPVISHGE